MTQSTAPSRDAVAPPHRTLGPGRTRLRAELRNVAPAIIGYAAVRLLGVAIFVLMAWRHDVDPLPELASWDGIWYRRIAADGYDTQLAYQPNGRLNFTTLAFSPAYPMLVRAASAVTGLSVLVAGVLISCLAGLAAAWGIAKVGEDVADRRTGVLLAVLWGVLPHAIVQSMVYTESLFTAFAAWSLQSVLRRRWVAAGLLACFAGATRSAAVPLIAAVVLTALIALLRRREGLRPLPAVMLPPLALVGFWVWVSYVVGRLDGWFYVQQGAWRMHFDGGAATLRVLATVVTQHVPLALYVTTLVVAVDIVLCVVLARQRPPWPLLAYAAFALVLVLGSAAFYHAKARFLLPVFPLLLPVARLLARVHPAAAAMIVVTLAAVSGWYGGYLLVLWTQSP